MKILLFLFFRLNGYNSAKLFLNIAYIGDAHDDKNNNNNGNTSFKLIARLTANICKMALLETTSGEVRNCLLSRD